MLSTWTNVTFSLGKEIMKLMLEDLYSLFPSPSVQVCGVDKKK